MTIPPAPHPTLTLAEQIARALFTNGFGEHAHRLVLTLDTTPRRDLGGWNERAAADVIEGILRREALGDREVYEANHDRDVWHRAYHETKARAERTERELATFKAAARVELAPGQEQERWMVTCPRCLGNSRRPKCSLCEGSGGVEAVLAAPPSPPTQEPTKE